MRGNATDAEKDFLNSFYDSFDRKPPLTEKFSEKEKTELNTRLWQVVQKSTTRPHTSLKWYRQYRWMAAAAVLLMAIAGILWFQFHQSNQKPGLATVQNDRLPAKTVAQLRLADGSILSLDSNLNASLPDQGTVKLNIDSGHLKYKGSANTTFYNTLSTPKGGNYHITLADNTKVWLNAASTLEFPVAFTGDFRNVMLKGEAYFEVTKSEKPFRVVVKDLETVEVVGTHFNIAAYPNNSTVETTLIEGKVKVVPHVNQKPVEAQAKVLHPGQQTVLTGGQIRVQKADIDQVMAWKNNMFYFENETLENILEEISRWYDVDIVFKHNTSLLTRRYFIMINRDANLSEVLKSLQINELKFEIHGRRLIIQ